MPSSVGASRVAVLAVLLSDDTLEGSNGKGMLVMTPLPYFSIKEELEIELDVDEVMAEEAGDSARSLCRNMSRALALGTIGTMLRFKPPGSAGVGCGS